MLFDRMTERMVGAMIETLPVEITVIDAKDEVVGWNKDVGRIFKRAHTSMGLNFRECHPKESLHKVVQIVDEMRQGTRDKARFYIDLPLTEGGPRHKILIEFYALRDYDGTYLGCMECTQDIQELRELEGERRILAE
jgi:PAS domain S-box-containing protein